MDIKQFIDDLINRPESMGSLDDIIKNSLEKIEEMLKFVREASPEEQAKIREQMVDMERQIKEKMGAIAERGSLSVEELQNMLKNPANFSEKDWSNLTDMQKQIQGKVEDFLGSRKEDLEEKSKDKLKLSKKDWLPI